MTATTLELCVVIPAYNESQCIEPVVHSWLNELNQTVGPSDFKIIVVNDGSKDNTGAILDKIAANSPRLTPIHKQNGGHGDALYHGYRLACELNPKYVFQTDSDDQFKPKDFIRLWEIRDKSKAILGYRQHRNDPFHRLIITRILRVLIGVFYGTYLVDSNVPYRLFEGNYFKSLFGALPERAFAPNIFLSILAARDGQQLYFIPIDHEERQTGVISIVKWGLIKVCLRSARELIAFRWTLRQRLTLLRNSDHVI